MSTMAHNVRRARVVGVASGIVAALVLVPTATSAATEPSWSTPIELTTSAAETSAADLLQEGDVTHAIWVDLDGGDRFVRTAASPDGGLTWSSPFTLASGVPSGITPQLTSRGGTVTAIWTRVVSGFSLVETAFTVDQGATWSSPSTLSSSGVQASSPLLVSIDGRLTAVWLSTTEAELGVSDFTIDVLTRTSTDGGATWASATKLTAPGSVAGSLQAAGGGDTIAVVWQNYRGGSSFIETSSSADGGITWDTAGTPFELGEPGLGVALTGIVTDDTRTTILWAPRGSDTFSIVRATSTDGGVAWSTDVLFTGSAFASYSVALGLTRAGSTLFATWVQLVPAGISDTPQVVVSSSADGGVTWSDPLASFGHEDLNTQEGAPSLIPSGSTVTALWVRDDEVLWSSTDDDGGTWTAPDVAFALEGTGVRYYDPNGVQPHFLHYATDGTRITALWQRSDTPSTILVSTLEVQETGDPELAATGASPSLGLGVLGASLLIGGAILVAARSRLLRPVHEST